MASLKSRPDVQLLRAALNPDYFVPHASRFPSFPTVALASYNQPLAIRTWRSLSTAQRWETAGKFQSRISFYRETSARLVQNWKG
jgi:hypothetical protein